MPYWDTDRFIFDDPLNAEIWTESPALQHQIQHPETLTAVGSIGPQQAMLDKHPDLGINPSDVLPWLPDLVGQQWESPEAVLVYGAAYAGFIREYSTRRASMPIAGYWEAAQLGAAGLGMFQERFLQWVVEPDDRYYGRVEALLDAVGIMPDKLMLSDLCPLSFVKRVVRNGHREDDSAQPTGERARTFHEYLQHRTVRDWTARRIRRSGSSRIVALGKLAEHGLLRLFRALGAEIRCQGEPWEPEPVPEEEPWAWVCRYAQPGRGLGFWLDEGTWWTVALEEREWRLLPIYHPARVGEYDEGYQATIPAMKHFLSGAG